MNESRTTERLTLRAPTQGDAASYRALLMHPTVGEWLRPPPSAPFEPDDGDLWLAEDLRHWERFGFGPWAALDRSGGEYLGRVGLRWSEIGDRAAIEILWTVDGRHHGRGFATEGAKAALDLAAEMDIDEVLAMILPTNTASLRVAEKIGMTRAGNVDHAGFDHLLLRFEPSGPKSA